MNILGKIIDLFHRPKHEPVYEEAVEHDTVMVMMDGKLTEVTGNDTETRQ